jgi:uncharacterized protein
MLIFNTKIMDIKKIHLIRGDNSINAMFYYPNFALYEINDLLYNVLSKYISGDDYNEISSELNIGFNSITQIIEKLEKSSPDNIIEDDKKELNKKKIGRITLHVSNDCNLHCSYCYADGGNYKLPKEKMSFEVADKFIEFCVNNFNQIDSIVFFGGEPLMNIQIIEYICLKFKKLKEDSTLTYLPNWGIITNGTLLNDNILKVLKEHINYITVSIDGPQKINDYNRKFRNNKGSFERIEKFINTIKRETNINIRYEATYTQYHLDSNVFEYELRAFFKKEFDLNGTIVGDINQNVVSFYNNKKNENLFDNLPEGFFSVLSAIVYKKRKEMCPVGNNIVAISTNGEIYPCHMNNGLKHLNLGTINSDNVFSNREKYLLNFPYLKSISKECEPCLNCWAQVICGGCSIRWFYDKETNTFNSKPNSDLCHSNKKHLEKILLMIVNLKKDKTKWKDFLEFAKNVNED